MKYESSLTNPHKLVDTLRSALKVESTNAMIAKYLGYLEDAFLFSKASRWDVKGKRYFDYPMKYYAEDIGLRNARLNFRDVDLSHTMENVIYNEFGVFAVFRFAARGHRHAGLDIGILRVSASKNEVAFKFSDASDACRMNTRNIRKRGNVKARQVSVSGKFQHL